MRLLTIAIVFLLSFNVFAQKKILDHPDFDIWNTIQNSTISNDGAYIMYALEKGEKDNFLKIKSANGASIFSYDRGSNGKFNFEGSHALFTIKPWKDSIVEMQRRKVKKDKMPKDTLGIYNLKTGQLDKIANLKSFQIPEKWGGYVAYYLENIPAKKKEKDSTDKKSTKKKAPKVGKDNGFHLVIRNLVTSREDTIKFVKNVEFAKEAKKLSFITTGVKDNSEPGVYLYDLESGSRKMLFTANKKSKYNQLTISEQGKNIAFVVDTDTTKAQIRPNELYLWKSGQDKASRLAGPMDAPKGYRVSPDGNVSFAKDASKLYFGLATPPVVKDTTLLKDEIVNVEVWSYDEPRLYTVQELQVKNDQRKSYLSVIDITKNNSSIVQLASTKYSNARLGNEGQASFALVSNPVPYQLENQWTIEGAQDYALVNVNTGETKDIYKKVSGRINLSPEGNFVYGYDNVKKTWFTYHIESGKKKELTNGKVFYNELNDAPNHPSTYGMAGWSKGDDKMFLYDRYDIWEFDPETGNSEKLTDGRPSKKVYRHIKLDSEKRYIDTSSDWLLSTFDETTKDAGFYNYNYKSGKGKVLIEGPYRFGRTKKAKNADKLLFTRESFIEFPNLRITDRKFKKQTVLTDANPQQSDYNWGTSELVYWNSLDGLPLQGMLIKPENFDPNKKYPMIVNFYEKSSNGLHAHKAPSPGRSTINYSFYTSRGYVIFNPDVHYKIGYPGESAFNCVIPGVTSLIEKGFIDADNIGVQGHSWGGYQIAHLVTETDIFKAAESGAPVVNMISAYGGIRWWTGLSRQFQYEHTQSRIGGTPWEYPARYIENSPIFFLDKVNTPLLILHNDADGHVPWYQGIEFFVSLRRLGKPAWMLNYNDEPHWPLKMQNRKDFNIRMAQFFDHYLKGAPLPVWMKHGVPAIEKGIHQGLELIDKK